eukprot:c28939_g1_i1 orf=507-3725(+)
MGSALLLGPSSVQCFHQIISLEMAKHNRKIWLNDNAAHVAGNFKQRRSRLTIYFCPIGLPLKTKGSCSLSVRCGPATTVGKGSELEDPIAESDEDNVEVLVSQETSGEEKLEVTDNPDVMPKNQPTQTGVRRQRRRIVVQKEDLIPGAVFTGKVTSIQPYGAFVDIAAFTDGLIHISRLSSSYVKAVEDVVKVGQEVNVQVLEVNVDARRISLMLKTDNDVHAHGDLFMRRGSYPPGSGPWNENQERLPDKDQKARIESSNPATEFAKGQIVKGIVKKVVKSGYFVSLPGGQEGFLHKSEVTGGKRVMVENSLQTDQEVPFCVLRIERGRIKLTLQKDFEIQELNKLVNEDTAGGATNPFELAFRQNKVIAKFLEERGRLEKTAVGFVSGLPGKEKVNEVPLADESEIQKEFLLRDVKEAVFKPPHAFGEKLDEEEVDNEQEYPPSVHQSGVSFVSENDGVVAVPEVEALTLVDEESAKGESILLQGVAASVGEVARAVQQDTSLAEKPAEVLTASSSMLDAGAGIQLVTEAEAQTMVDEESAKGESVLLQVTAASVGKVDASLVGMQSEELTSSLTLDTGIGSQHVSDGVSVDDNLLEVSHDSKLAEDVAITDKGDEMGTSHVFLLDNVMDEEVIGVEEFVAKDMGSTEAVETQDVLVKDIEDQTKMDVSMFELESVSDINQVYKQPESPAFEEQNLLPNASSETDAVNAINVERTLVSSTILNQVSDEANTFACDETDSISSLQEIGKKGTTPEIQVNEQAERSVTEKKDLLLNACTQTDTDNEISVTNFESLTVLNGVSNEGKTLLLESSKSDFISTQQEVNQIVSPSVCDANSNWVQESISKSLDRNAISASLVKQLREETGAGLMDCKKALTEVAGDMEKAQEFLRKKGLADAEEKAGRIATEGRVGSYIHDNRIGALVEVNCETDFVARSDIFKNLVEDLGMQIVACPQVQFVSVEDVSPEIVNKEREIEMQREDLLKKPEQIRQKIVEGRIAKWLEELALFEQPYIKDDNILVKDYVKQTISVLGENIRVRRFLRYNLGEDLEKSSQDFTVDATQIKVKQTALIG